MNDATPIRMPVIPPQLVETFTGLVCEGREHDTIVMIEQLLSGGASPESLMLDLLAPSARLMGEFWCEDRRDFLEVTVGMARLQQLVRQFRLPPPAEHQLLGHALLLPVPGEQHTFGLRVVEEHLLRAGWKVTAILKASETDIARLVAEEAYDFIGFSAASERLLPDLRSAIRIVRSSSRNLKVRIAVGGVLFDGRDIAPEEIDADMIVTDARDAVIQAHAIFSVAEME